MSGFSITGREVKVMTHSMATKAKTPLMAVVVMITWKVATTVVIPMFSKPGMARISLPKSPAKMKKQTPYGLKVRKRQMPASAAMVITSSSMPMVTAIK